jgi:transcriptional regulator with XRE-family HTH domain
MSISRSHVANLETGGSEPSDHLLSLMCANFGINFDWLKHGQGSLELYGPELDTAQQSLFNTFMAAAPFRSALGQLQGFSKLYDEAAMYLIRSLNAALKADPALCPIELVEGLRELLSKREGEPFKSAEKLLQRCEPHAKAKNERELHLW